MTERLPICSINCILTALPLLASIGAIRSAIRINTASVAPDTFLTRVKNVTSIQYMIVFSDMSLMMLQFIVLVAVIDQWALENVTILARCAIFVEASLGVVIPIFFLNTWKRPSVRGLLFLAWVGFTVGLFIPSFVVYVVLH